MWGLFFLQRDLHKVLWRLQVQTRFSCWSLASLARYLQTSWISLWHYITDRNPHQDSFELNLISVPEGCKHSLLCLFFGGGGVQSIELKLIWRMSFQNKHVENVYMILMSFRSNLHSLELLCLPIIYSSSSHQSPDLTQLHLIKLYSDPNIARLRSLLSLCQTFECLLY